MSNVLETLRVLLSKKLSDAEVQTFIDELTAASRNGSIAIQKDATGAVIIIGNQNIVGNNNHLTINQGIEPEELIIILRNLLLEIQHSMQDDRTPNRATLLEQLHQESRARCIVRWLAAGVSEETAGEFADHPNIRKLPRDLQLIPGKVILLTGVMGIGKSLIVERLFQNAVAQMTQDADVPIACHLESWQWRNERPLQKVVETLVANFGNPKTQGAIIFINGADEVISAANDLLDEARYLVKAWSNTTIVITSRPIRTLNEAQDIIQVAVTELTISQSCTLISQVAEQPFTEYEVLKWSPSLQSVIKLPLFALLLADYLKAKDIRVPQSTGELLNNLIEGSLGQEVADRESANRFLQTLAIRCIEYSGPVHTTEVFASRADFQTILSSRLVIEQQGKIRFALPILNEWFAAQSLIAGNPEPELLAQDTDQLESWRYPLIMAIATSGHNQVSRFLTPIAKAHPALAAEVVSAALASRFIDMPPPPWRICGQRVREAMQAWIIGLDQPPQQPLAQLIAPVHQNGLVRKIGVRSEVGKLTMGWYEGSEEIEDVVELHPSLGVGNFSPIFSVGNIQFHRDSASARWLGPQPAWAWLWTLDNLVASLTKLIQRRGLTIDYELLAQEALWKRARSILLCSRNSSYHYFSIHRAVPLNILEAVLAEFNPTFSSFGFSGVKTIYREDLNYLAMKVAELRAIGKTQLDPPWAVPDRYSVEEFPWKCYTLEQIKAYAEYVYLQALNGYQHTVNTWFPKFADRLKLSVLMPVHLVGAIAFSDSDNEPNLYWHFEALPYDESNKVSFSIVEQSVAEKEFFSPKISKQANDQRHVLRPGKSLLLGNTSFQHSGLRLFQSTSATELVYNWLWDDLQRVSWVNGFLGSPPR